jgi:hypothetical protein
MSVLSCPHDLVSPYYRAHQRHNRSREDDHFKPHAATPAKNSVQSEYQRDGEAQTEHDHCRYRDDRCEVLHLGIFRAVSEGEGRSLAWTMPQALRSPPPSDRQSIE